MLAGFALAWDGDPAAAIEVDTEAEFRKAWSAPRVRVIELDRDIVLRSCRLADPIRESSTAIRVIGDGHSIRQTCFENRLLRQDGTGFVQLENLNLSRGGSDGPGAAVTARGEIRILDSRISKNLAEEPGGGVFSMRRAVVIRSVLNGNLANDDGGAVYARRGGILVKDSVLNGNLVDGSGGALGSTGDIKVIRSSVDGNITDGDGGAIYTDEDGDVTVVDSSVSGNTADGPGGAIFTLDGDVTVVGSVLNGNRADDRGGAISGESDVTMLRSTVSRNVSEAHAAGGIWARGDLFVSGSTVSQNSAQGQGGGILGGGDVKVAYSSILENTAPYVSNVAASSDLEAFGSVIGPPSGQPFSDPVSCRAHRVTSHGYNVSSDGSCRLDGPADAEHATPGLGALLFNGGIGDTMLPLAGSAVIDRIPIGRCPFVPFGYRREGEQHLASLGIDPLAPTVSDQRGVARPFGPGCDSGSIERAESSALSRSPDVRSASPGPGSPTVRPSSPRPETQPAGSNYNSKAEPRPGRPRKSKGLRGIGRLMNSISARLGRMERSDARYRRWRRCIRQVPVSLVGNRNGRFGYVYNEVDGTGSGFRTALAIDRRKPSDFRFLDFSTRRGCRSDTTKPDGTADPASVSPSLLDRPPTHRLTRPAKRPAKRLVRRLARLERRAKAVERSAKRFDRWESCLTWLPVTEYGDPEHRFGFRWLAKGRKSGFAAAVAVDRSPWDDPDYTLLTFAGNDLPGIRGCEGEGAPAGLPIGSDPTVRYSLRGRPRRDRVSDLRRDTRDLAESVEDLIEPNLEFVTFDQCMYTVGMTRRGRDGGKRGFAFRNRKGVRSTRSALAMDMSGFDAPEYNFMAFSGEEPPQIECNEDAGGLDTDE